MAGGRDNQDPQSFKTASPCSSAAAGKGVSRLPLGHPRLLRKAPLVAQLLRRKASESAGQHGRGVSIPRGASLLRPSGRGCRAHENVPFAESAVFPRRLPWRFIAPALGRSLPATAGTVVRGHGVQLVVCSEPFLGTPYCEAREKELFYREVSETGSFSVPGIGVRVKFARCSGKRSPAAEETALLARDIEPPLVLRSRRRGDEILLEHGATPLKELFAGWKVSVGHRQQVPILADRKGVVAVLGRALGYPSRTGGALWFPVAGTRIASLYEQAGNMEEGREQQ